MKLFVFDVDGTLIENYGKLKKSTIEAINICLDRGDAVCIASGRPLNGIKRYLKKFHKGKKYAICANGAALCDFDGNTYYESTIPYHVLTRSKELFDSKMGKKGEIYCYIKHELGYFNLKFYSLNEIRLNRMKKVNLSKYPLKDNDPIYKVMLAAPKEILDGLQMPDDIKNNYHIVKSAPYFMEIINKNTDKYYAVKALAELLKIGKEDVYCFGDEDNDLLMIKNFNGVAMGNAIEEVKQVAHIITKPVSEDGVSYAIKELIK